MPDLKYHLSKSIKKHEDVGTTESKRRKRRKLRKSWLLSDAIYPERKTKFGLPSPGIEAELLCKSSNEPSYFSSSNSDNELTKSSDAAESGKNPQHIVSEMKETKYSTSPSESKYGHHKLKLSAKHLISGNRKFTKYLTTFINNITKQRSLEHQEMELFVDISELELFKMSGKLGSQVRFVHLEIDKSFKVRKLRCHFSLMVTQKEKHCSVSDWTIKAFSGIFHHLNELFHFESVDVSNCTLPTQVLLLPSSLSALNMKWSSMKVICTFFKDFLHLKEEEVMHIPELTKPLVEKHEVSEEQVQALINHSFISLPVYDAKVIQALIEVGADVNITDKDGKTALFYALYYEKVTHALIKAGVDVNKTDKDGKPVLFYALDNQKLTSELIEASADVKITDKNGKTALFYAANEEVAHALIDAGADVNKPDKDGKTALFYAANEEVAHALIDAGADVKKIDKYGKTALFYAANEKKAHALIDAGADVNKTDKDGKTALFYAANEKVALALIKAGADVNIKNKDGESALFYVVENEEVTHALIAAGADMSITDKDGKTALFYAVHYEEVFNALIAAGADVNISEKDGKTALFYALDSEMILHALSEAGADVNKTDEDGKTALFYLILNENVTKALVEAGCDVNKTDKDGRTALFYPVWNNKVFHALIETGADVNITDKDDRTALFYFLEESEENARHALIKAGADVNITDKYGKTALFYAANEKVSHALIEAGADVNITDKDGKTALFYFLEESEENVRHALIEAGADVNITDKDGKTALFFAANEKVSHALIEAGTDVNITDKDGKTALFYALDLCNEKIIHALIEAGASLCETTDEEESVFHFILKFYQTEIAVDNHQKRYALPGLGKIFQLFSESKESKVAVNKRDIHLNSPLHLWASLNLASSYNYHNFVCDGYSFKTLLKVILGLLLQCGVMLDNSNKYKQTPLHMCRTWTAVKLLLDAGAEPDVKDLSGCTPLLAAAKRNTCIENDSVYFYPDVTQTPNEFWKEVLNRKLDPWTADKNGDSVFSILIQKEANSLAKALIEVSCELKYVQSDTTGLPLLITICSDKSRDKEWKVDLVKTLLKYRNSLAQERLSDKDTALHICCRNMLQLPKESVKTSVHWKIAQHLILCGADVETAGKEGKSFLDIAESCSVLKNLLPMPENIEEVPPLIDLWKTDSERHQSQLAKVSRGFNCQQIETVFYFNKSLDSGTFGLVFVGINAENGKEVAVKRVEAMRVDKENIKKEIEDLKLVMSCDKVLQCLLCTDDKDFLYVILELMEGNLDDLLSERKYSFDINQKTKLCKDICTGLDYLHNHDRNIIHKSMKPSNVLYQVRHSAINLKLAFFGLKSQICKEQYTSDFTDTYESLIKEKCWMAPEVLQSQSHSKSSDVFSCGLVIHYLLTNKKHPFAPGVSRKDSPLTVSIENVDNIAQNRIELDGKISSDANDLLKGMLDHDTSKRTSISNALEHRFFLS